MDSDPDIEFIEKDSGMSSLGGSKDDTPERRSNEAPSNEVPVVEDLLNDAPLAPLDEALLNDGPLDEALLNDGPLDEALINDAPLDGPLLNEAPAKSNVVATKDTDNYDEEPDETFGERLLGLTEMFPNCVRNFTGNVVDYTHNSVKALYSFTCSASWIFFTSSVILFAPVIFETERAQMEEMQKTQQKQVLLGPGNAMALTGPPTSPGMPLMR